ncbi:murein biosynthesis integral membrane protein MurJ [Desulfomonile tiedjei]|uniref:Probable lipid II flippase MurJ n=1 Tax=Desulfomonile tiedjei (strain ATCC 49306 / DSM 6799 / DCB-1) TaxID=706587 RepID=I4C7K2_DESTA|nr:murein biosynthesis integral membrane protein MurJ [Desulfomonile tiedjei]AFM25543.1 integral membrane protein MviN [Desulfomonile tiedjei DSM 6799]
MAENPISSQAFSSTPKKPAVSEQKLVARAAGVVGFWTTLSRVLGFVRDMVIALFLGAGPGADAFFVAFRIPNLLRRLFAEGALSAAFIPTYVDTLQQLGKTEAARLARIAFTFTTIALAAVTLTGIAFSPLIVRLTAPGFFDDPSKFGLTVELTRTMFPYIFFISLVALASGILNSLGHFSAPAAAPVLLNLSMITSVAICATWLKVPPFYALAWGVVVAGVLQLALQIPFLWALGVKLYPDFHLRHPALKRMGLLFLPAAFGGAVYQLNVLVGTILASMLPVGGVSWLYYADRIVELPLGIFAIALGTAILPSMSRQASNGDFAGLTRSVSFGLRLIAFFTIPASVALIVLAEPIIAVLFQRGAFTSTDTTQTAYALFYYTLGLWAFSGLKVVVQAFFSLKDTRTPLWVSMGAVAVNLVGGLLLMGPMAQGGLALATSLAAALNVLVLFAILVKRLGRFPTEQFIKSLLRVSAASAIMGGALLYGRTFGTWPAGLTATNGLVLSGCVLGGLAIFAVSAFGLRCQELDSLLAIAGIKRQKSGNAD